MHDAFYTNTKVLNKTLFHIGQFQYNFDDKLIGHNKSNLDTVVFRLKGPYKTAFKYFLFIRPWTIASTQQKITSIKSKVSKFAVKLAKRYQGLWVGLVCGLERNLLMASRNRRISYK